MGVAYTLKRSKRARAMRMEVQADGSVVVVAPYVAGLTAIERFVLRHSAWARRKIEEMSGRTVIRIARRDVPALKRQTYDFAHERCRHFAQLLGVSYRAITVRAQKTRWGSCSQNGNLSFNYRISALPQPLADYVVVHELCHLREFSHSKDFWRLVGSIVPDHKKLRAQMRRIAFMYH